MKWQDWGLTVGLIAAGIAVVVMNNSGPSDAIVATKTPDRSKYCRSLRGEQSVRLDECVKEITRVTLSAAAESTLAGLLESGSIMTVAAPLSIDGDLVRFDEKPEIKALMQGTSESKLSRALRDMGVRGLVVHRDLTEALDRDKVVLSRLAHHDHLEWFQLRRVTDELMIYTVRGSRSRVPLSTGESLLKGLRARLAGKNVPRQTWKPETVRLIGTLRLQGNALAIRHAVGTNLEAVLSELALKLRSRWDREVAIEGHGSLDSRLDDIRLEIHVVMERAPVEPRSRYAIFHLWELGVDGMMYRHREGVENDKFTYMPGSEASVRSMKTGDQFLRYAVKKGGWHDLRPWEDSTTRLDLIRTQHFMEGEAGGGKAVRLIRGFPEVTQESITDRRLQQMLIDGGEWWLENLRSDNSFEYKYWPAQNRRSTEYNEVRHILAARDLADTWRYRNDERYLVGSRRSMDWLLKYEVHDDDPVHPGLPHPPAKSMLFRYPSFDEKASKPPNQKLGTVAVALLGWVAWADSTGSTVEDTRIRKMAEFVLTQLEETGKFTPYYVYRGHPYFGEKNDIVPGEAALALGMVAEYFGENDWLDFFPKFMGFYKPWFSERKQKTNPYGRWPHASYSNETRLDLVQFGPWAVMASKQYYKMTGNEEAAAFGLEIADWMIDYYQWSEARSPFPDYVGGYYKLPEELPAMQSFCYSEGTAAAYQIASTFRPEHKEKYERSTLETLRFLDLMQFDSSSSYFAADPTKINGGIKYAMNENKIRIDYVGHGLSTISQFLDAKKLDPAETVDIRDPKGWPILNEPEPVLDEASAERDG